MRLFKDGFRKYGFRTYSMYQSPFQSPGNKESLIKEIELVNKNLLKEIECNLKERNNNVENLKNGINDLRVEISNVREDVRKEINNVGRNLKEGINNVKQDLRKEIEQALRENTKKEFEELKLQNIVKKANFSLKNFLGNEKLRNELKEMRKDIIFLTWIFLRKYLLC
jgi:F0F1-type ATP synthase membrane subunit b/b'